MSELEKAKQEAEHIAKQCINAEIIEEKQDV